MSIKTVANKIQALVGASTRINLAPNIEDWPSAINSADLPVALTRPGPGRWPHEALADVWHRRTYVIEIYVKPTAQGLYAEGVEETLAIIDDVAGRLTTGFTLEDLAIDSEPRDGGLMLLVYGGVEYRGTEFQLDVIEDV